MGDPKRIRKKFDTPIHPWQGSRLDSEKPLMKIYGLSNKKELWKIASKLKSFKDNAKSLVAKTGNQAELETKQLFDRLKSLNLLESNELDAVLGMNIEQLLDRRLQTVVFKQSLARSIKQARQMITHGHIFVAGKKVTAPGYLVKINEEASITFATNSAFKEEDHPERVVPEQKAEKTKETEKAEKVRDEKKKVKKTNSEKQKTPKTEEKKKDKPVEAKPKVGEQKAEEVSQTADSQKADGDKK